MPKRWNVLKVAAYAALIGAVYGAIGAADAWQVHPAEAIGQMFGAAMAAAFVASVFVAIRNAIVRV